jgi:hypothetical protein
MEANSLWMADQKRRICAIARIDDFFRDKESLMVGSAPQGLLSDHAHDAEVLRYIGARWFNL